ncbi:MAG: hypothetical protein ACLQME_00195 [Alphaproteobacteria bacterium]
MNEATLTQIQTRLQRVERQNRVLIALLCAAAGTVLLGATSPEPKVISVDEIRAHRFTLLDPNGDVADWWYSDSPGGYHGP